MKILHAPKNTASLPWLISRAQRKLGHQSDLLTMSWQPYVMGIPEYNFGIYTTPRLLRPFVRIGHSAAFLPKLLRDYDVVHYHSETLLPDMLDVQMLRKLSKGTKIIFHFSGGDIRSEKNSPKSWRQDPKAYREKKKLIANARKYGDALCVFGPDLLDEVPEAHVIPIALDASEWQYPKEYRKPERDEIVILHAPTRRAAWGTDEVETAVRKLQKEGHPVVLRVVENVPRSEVKSHYLDVDIAVDNVGIGWYGVFAGELMLLGKPVLSNLREDLRHHVPGCPIVGINSETLVDELRVLLEDGKQRRDLGRKGKQFATRFHDSIKVARKINKIYEEA